MAENNLLLITRDEKKIVTALCDVDSAKNGSKAGKISSLQVESPGKQSRLKNIYIGKVNNVVKNLNAAFVEFLPGQVGYLSFADAKNPNFTDGRKHKKDSIVQGDELLIQIKSEAVKSKPPTLSTVLEFSGRYAVLSSVPDRNGISKKIKDKGDRERLREILSRYNKEPFSVLLRTKSANASREEIIDQISALQKTYEDCLSESAYRKKFTCLYETPSACLLAIQRLDAACAPEIITDSAEIFDQVQKYLQTRGLEREFTLKFWEESAGNFDAVYGISKTLAGALNERVWLKNGAYIIIEPTEALVCIDVNTGKAVAKGKNVQENFLTVNMLAAKEIACQIRLRNLSGIILVDFIDMEKKEHRKKLLSVFRQELEKDPIPTTLVDMTKLGLAEVTRKRERKSLAEQMREAEAH